MGRTGFAAVVVVSSTLLTGCAGGPGNPDGLACPAIGWLNNLVVELEGDASAVAVVQGCVEDVCSQVMQLPVEPEAPAEVPPPDPNVTPPDPDGGSTGAETAREPSPYFASRLDEDSWSVNFGMSAPEQVSVRALDGAGEVLAEEDFTLDWVRVGGSERCGGPSEAGPVTLFVP